MDELGNSDSSETTVRLRGQALANVELMGSVRSPSRRNQRTINFALAGSEELRYLDAMNANANVGGEKMTHIILRADARRIEVLEEFLHGTQLQIGLLNRLGVRDAEMHVKHFMLRHTKMLGISQADTEILRQMLGDAA